MIRNLQKKISLLFLLLLSITWISILSIYVTNIYRSNLLNIEDKIREEVKDENWKNFIILRRPAAQPDRRQSHPRGTP